MNHIEIGVWSTMAVDREYIGSYLDRGELGVEAFDAGDNLIDVFSDTDAAHKAVFDCWEWKDWLKDGDANPGDEPHSSGKSDGHAGHAASDIDTRTVMVTFFPNKSAQSQRRAELTLPQLAEQIRLKTGPSKMGLPWLKLMTFGNKRSGKGCLRTNANAEAITGIEVEHDAGTVTFDEAIAIVRKARIRALPYTSPSYVPAAKERWRILLPLSSSLPPGARAMLVARVNGLFDGKLAGESFTLSQAYIYGRVNDNPAHRVEVIDGDFIDLRTDLDPGATGKSATYNGTGAAGGGPSASPAPRLHSKKTAAPLPDIEVAPAFKHLDAKAGLADGIVFDDTPLPFAPIMEGCAWLREAFETGGKDHNQPQWHLMVLAMTFVENGHELAHQCSDKHPDYGRGEQTEGMWDRKVRERKELNLGWPGCAAIETAGSTPCKACPHRDKGESPIHLALQGAPAAEEILQKPGAKLPLIVELGSRLWGPPTATIGKEYRFGADQSKAVDPGKGAWVDFTTMKGGYLKDLMKKATAAANREQPNVDDVVVICAADVVMRPLDWIWEGHLLRGSQELLSGLPDLSKSTVQIGYIACATARLPWPDGAKAVEPMNVIMLTAEDTLDQIVVPRLRAAGADVSRVKFLKCIKTDEHDRQFLLAEDLDRLDRLVKKIGDVGLITIDPITAYMGGRRTHTKPPRCARNWDR